MLFSSFYMQQSFLSDIQLHVCQVTVAFIGLAIKLNCNKPIIPLWNIPCQLLSELQSTWFAVDHCNHTIIPSHTAFSFSLPILKKKWGGGSLPTPAKKGGNWPGGGAIYRVGSLPTSNRYSPYSGVQFFRLCLNIVFCFVVGPFDQYFVKVR